MLGGVENQSVAWIHEHVCSRLSSGQALIVSPEGRGLVIEKE
jgi:hypothetical protein